MKNSIKLGQGLAWAAWLVFIASLFMPMETNSLAGPCAWPCTRPFTDYGWQNASFFAMSVLVFALNLVQALSYAIFDPQTLGRILENVFTMGLYAVIALGQALILLAPLWPARINNASWQRLHLWLVILSVLSALAYGLVPNLRLGLELLGGYYLWLLSFVLLLLASIVMHRKKNRDHGHAFGQGALHTR